MVLTMEQPIKPTAVKPLGSTELHGSIDYMATVMPQTKADNFRSDPTVNHLRAVMSSCLVVTEAKSFSTSLRDHVPQAVAKMYACAKVFKKDVIRGALTAGNKWMFLVLVINDNGDGAKCWQSRGINILDESGPESGAKAVAPWPDVVAGILAHWDSRRRTVLKR